MILTLDEIKTQLRLPLAADAELDAELVRMEAAAVDYATQYLGRDSIPWLEDDGVTPAPVPESVRQALLLLVSDMFENREGQLTAGAYNTNPMLEKLMHCHRVGLGV